MAATVSAWAKPGAWALDSEENEAELLQQGKEDTVNGNAHSNGGGDAFADFPSLSAAAATKAKKKKGQTLSLQEFASYGSVKTAQSATAPASKGLTPEEVMMLPTGPRQRTAEELDRSRLGGGFRSYGYDRQPRGSSDEPRRQGGFRDSNREVMSSRSDEIDDWAAAKKSTLGNGFERRERGDRGGFFSDSHSRADDSDNWSSNKSFVPSEGRRFDRRGSFQSNGGGADSDNWGKKKEEDGRKFGSSGGSFDSLRERRGSYESMNGSDSENWGRKREEASVGSGRPRLNLQPRTLPLGEIQQKNESEGETILKAKGSSPFGEARPREEVLKEKGQDWKELDEKLESMKIKEVTASTDGKRSFGSGNRRPSLPENKTERSWRKSDSADTPPSSPGQTEDGPIEDGIEGDAQN